MIYKKLDINNLNVIEDINNEAFPLYERITITQMKLLLTKTSCDIVACFDNELIGFYIIVYNNQCGYVFYLAVDKIFRNKGYGSQILKDIQNNYHFPIILDFEDPLEKCNNLNIRLRRKEFYLRNNFKLTNHYTILDGGRFEVVCNQELPKQSFKDIIHTLSLYIPTFKDELV